MLSVPFGDEIAMDYYGGLNKYYETDLKKVKGARQHCEQLIDELKHVKDEEILKSLPRVFSGRLSFINGSFEYTAGQFYNIEVPQSVEAVLEEIKRNRASN